MASAPSDPRAGERSVRSEGVCGAVRNEQVVDDHRRDGPAQLRHCRGHAEGADAQGRSGLEGAQGPDERQRRVLLEEELHDESSRDAPRAYGGQARAAHAAIKHDDEQVAEHHVRSGSDEHGSERAVRPPRRADEVVHAEGDELQRAARDDHRHEVEREGKHDLVGARVAQDGLERERRGDPEQRRGAEQEHKARAHHALGHVLPALPQLDGGERVAAHAYEHGHGHERRHRGVRHRGGGQAVRAHRMSHVHGVDHVVEHLHEHAHHGRDGELEQQLEGALGSHPVDAVPLGALRARSGRDACLAAFHVLSIRALDEAGNRPARGDGCPQTLFEHGRYPATST